MARTIIGTVVSDKSDKTIIISVHARKTHPIYKKQYSVTTKFMAHDEKNTAKMGDQVEIIECRPLSARKRFTINKIIKNAKVLHIEPEAETPVASRKLPVEKSKLKTEDKPLETATLEEVL